MSDEMTHGRLPTHFETAEDEAKFWDTTDLTTLPPDQVRDVKLAPRRRPPATTFAIRLQRSTVAEIRELARTRGVGPTQLVRTWILERLSAELTAGSAVRNIPRGIRDPLLEYAFSAVNQELGPAIAKLLEATAVRLAIDPSVVPSTDSETTDSEDDEELRARPAASQAEA